MQAAVGAVQIPGLAVAQVDIQLQGLILSQHAHGVHAGVDAVGEGEVDDAILTTEGDGRLGHVLGQRVETAALTAGQQHCHTFFFHELVHLNIK